MKGRALLFGLNYDHDPNLKLSGCINDVKNMALFLKNDVGIQVEAYTDDVDKYNTSAMGMLKKLYELALLSHKEKLDFVWIHYSGHGSSVIDGNNDETDGYDECLVPTDANTRGVIVDDCIKSVIENFNPQTKVVCIFDCCHSGTICDVKYSWEAQVSKEENKNCKVQSKVITISGCRDDQTSADAYNVLNDNQFAGALTACFLMAIREPNNQLTYNVFDLVAKLRQLLREKGFTQVPKLCSTFDLTKDITLIPISLNYV